MSVWNNREWWKTKDIEMYDTSTTELIVIRDPADGKLYSISPEDGENIDLWANNGMTPDMVCRVLVGLTNKDPILGNVMTYLDEFDKTDTPEALKNLEKACKLLESNYKNEGPGSAEFGKDQPDPSK